MTAIDPGEAAVNDPTAPDFLAELGRFFRAAVRQVEFWFGTVGFTLLLLYPIAALWLPRMSMPLALAAWFFLPGATAIGLYVAGPVFLGIVNLFQNAPNQISWIAAPIKWFWKSWKVLVGIEMLIGFGGICMSLLPEEARSVFGIPVLPVIIGLMVITWFLNGHPLRGIASAMLFVFLLTAGIHAGKVIWDKHPHLLDEISPGGGRHESVDTNPVLTMPAPPHEWKLAEIVVPPKGKSEPIKRPTGAKHFWWDPSGDLEATCTFKDGNSQTMASWKTCRGVQEVQFSNPHDEPVSVAIYYQM